MSKLVAVQSKGKVAKAMKIPGSNRALSAKPHVHPSQAKRDNAKSNRYLTHVAREQEGDEEFGGDVEESQECAEEGEEQDEECFVATKIVLVLVVPFPALCGSRALRTRGKRGATAVRNVAGKVQSDNCRG